VAGDHCARALGEACETNHGDVNEKKNEKTRDDEVNGACGLLTTEHAHEDRENGGDRRRPSEPSPDHQWKEHEDNRQIGESLKDVIGQAFFSVDRFKCA
jgi:hypothetical protein